MHLSVPYTHTHSGGVKWDSLSFGVDLPPFLFAYDWMYVLFVTQRKESILSRRTHVHKRCEQKQNTKKKHKTTSNPTPNLACCNTTASLADKREPYARKVINISSVTSCLARGETWVCSRFSVAGSLSLVLRVTLDGCGVHVEHRAHIVVEGGGNKFKLLTRR